MTIDWWTLGIQTINIAILIWLLGRYFWRPVAAMIEQRRAAAQQILDDAETKRSQAADVLAEVERMRAGIARERDAILAAAHAAADQARTALLAAARQEAATLGAAIQKERDAAEKAWTERASLLAIDIARRLMARMEGPAARAAFLGRLVDELRTLPDATRQTLAANGAALEAISATMLEPADQERCQQRIGEVLGAEQHILFKADPDLIAGLELHGPHLVLNNSWQADLAQILADLTHDSRP